MDRGLTGIARIVIRSNDFIRQEILGANRVQPFEKRPVDLPPVEDNRARL
jgi:hypothetical protein